MENNSCIIYKDFLPTEVNANLYNHAISQKAAFEHTKVAENNGNIQINPNWRHSVSLPYKHFIEFHNLLKIRVKSIYKDIAKELGLAPFECGRIEMHITSHNDGEFFKPHVDTGDLYTGRIITFVYYFHSIPKKFEGGQLLFLRNKPKPLIVEPTNNSIVFFDSRLIHAVHPVSCPGAIFENGRFTLNGWIWKKTEE